MARILIGSSNIYRFYEAGKLPAHQQYKLTTCTNAEVFKAKMDDLRNEDKKVVISVIENFVCDAVRGVSDDMVANGLCEKAIKDYLNTVNETAKRLPGTRFALAQPILRPGNSWYSEKYEDVCNYHSAGINAMSSSTNVMKLDPLSIMSQKFEYDGVHLTTECGTIFVQTTLDKAEVFFDAELVNLEDGMELMEKEIKTSEATGTSEESLLKKQGKPELGYRLTRLEIKVDNMGTDIENRRFHDSLVTARIRDELDAMTNINKEDRIIITGMTNKTPMPQGFTETKKWLSEMVGEVLNRIEQGMATKIVWINQGRKNGREIPMAEVKMESRAVAHEIRKKFAERKRGGEDYGRLFIANSVSLGTRVRIDILKAIAKKHNNEKQDFHVAAFSSRPVLQVREKGVEKKPMVLTFIDAVTRYGRGMMEDDLVEAYRRAGRSFQGQLQQNFVVLRDRSNAQAVDGRGPSSSTPRKRQREGDVKSQSGKRGARGGRGMR